MEIAFPTDSDGFLSQECPSCVHLFKIVLGEGSEEPVSYCPYCGHNGEDCWYTQPQIDHFKNVAMKEALEQLSRGSRGLEITPSTRLNGSLQPPMETDDPLAILRFPCCNEAIKVDRRDRHFCIICGDEVDMEKSDSKKIFLSHKGDDKQEVIEYRDALKSLGYSPWLDIDQMPAGAALERAILKGMEDSCGVVFFITPSFSDEGFLESEVDYAVAEKRKKGDRFAIVALQFSDSEGRTGSIPDLLKKYVWKQPKNQLEALREIVRALPIEVGPPDWRDGIEGVVKLPVAKSTSAALSDEAKVILCEAAAGDGRVSLSRLMRGTTSISANGKNLIPDRNERTIAVWQGGLEDLRRRGLVRDVGHKGQVFKVTREGYLMVDELGGVNS